MSLTYPALFPETPLRAGAGAAAPAPTTVRVRTGAPDEDGRFRDLLGDTAWSRLPPSVRRRFSRRLAPGETALFAGQIVAMRRSFAGWLLTQLARPIGAPLPLSAMRGMPAAVTVAEAPGLGGQTWTRIYGRHRRFPQAIHSVKRFAGPTGLEEYLGGGISMALTLAVEGDALVFRSREYLLRLGDVRIRLPRWLSPGAMTVTHREEPADRFSFTLEVHHPWFGLLLHQTALFRETEG
jgi:hypothetical protein